MTTQATAPSKEELAADLREFYDNECPALDDLPGYVEESPLRFGLIIAPDPVTGFTRALACVSFTLPTPPDPLSCAVIFEDDALSGYSPKQGTLEQLADALQYLDERARAVEAALGALTPGL